MSFEIIQLKLLREHANYERKLHEFSKEELKKFPLEYLLDHAQPAELLYAWNKLPSEYTHNHFLQIRLPCFIHYNNPFHMEEHVDAPVPSQNKCYSCQIVFK